MKPRIKKMNWFIKMVTFNWADGITLAPFGIYVKEKYLNDKVILNHEKIHWQQQLEMGIVFYYAWYFIEWTMRLPYDKNRAYRKLSMEKESYANEKNLKYLETRKKFAWKEYLTR